MHGCNLGSISKAASLDGRTQAPPSNSIWENKSEATDDHTSAASSNSFKTKAPNSSKFVDTQVCSPAERHTHRTSSSIPHTGCTHTPTPQPVPRRLRRHPRGGHRLRRRRSAHRRRRDNGSCRRRLMYRHRQRLMMITTSGRHRRLLSMMVVHDRHR